MPIESFKCVGGPWDGAELILSTGSSMSFEMKGWEGRYVLSPDDVLVWESTRLKERNYEGMEEAWLR